MELEIGIDLRSAGFTILGLADGRCFGVFDNIDEVVPKAEHDEFMARYKQAAGFVIEALNAAPPIRTPTRELAMYSRKGASAALQYWNS